jgi:hypothetical protein
MEIPLCLLKNGHDIIVLKIRSTRKKLTHMAVWKNGCTLEPAYAQDSFEDWLDQQEAK